MAQRNDEVNEAIIRLARSLLQFTGECWPWVDDTERDIRSELDVLRSQQQDHVIQLTELLERREVPIDYGTYPAEFTALHYVALDYLLKELTKDQKELVAALDSLAAAAADDPEAADALSQVAREEREIADRIEQLAGEHPPAAQAATG